MPVLWLSVQPGLSPPFRRFAPVLVLPMIDSSRAVEAGDSNSPRFSRASALTIALGAAPS